MSDTYKVLSRQDKSQLLADVGIEKVLDLCCEARPTHGCVRKGNQIKARCMFPGHTDNNPSMGIIFSPDRVFMKCLSCGQYESDGFKICSHITGVYSTPRIYAEIFGQRFGQRLSPEQDEALAQEDLISHLKSELMGASSHVLNAAGMQLGKEYAYAQDAVNFLQKRGFPASSFMRLGIGVFPTLEHLGANIDRDALVTVEDYLGKHIFESKPKAVGRYGGWLVFPYYTTPTSIGRIKLRDPKDKTNEIWLGTHKKEPRGFFGLNQFTQLIGLDMDAARDAYLVEGEFDQLAMAEAQVAANPNTQHLVIGASGAAASDLDLLANSRIARVTIVGDNDPGGQTFVRRVLETAQQSRVYDFAVYDWGTLAQYNDPDEVVQGGNYADLIHGLTKRVDVKELHEWAVDRTQDALARLNKPSTVQQMDVLNDQCSYIKNECERDLYISAVSEATGIEARVLARHLVDIESERGFLLNIERLLYETTVPIATDGPGIALFYSKRSGEIFDIPMAKPRDVELAFQAQVFGMRTYDYLASTIGIPLKIQMTQGKTPIERPLLHQAKEVSAQFDWAVQNVVATAQPLAKFRIRRQGIHWADTDLDALDASMLPPGSAPQRVYVVNAHHRFIGEPGKNGLMVYQEMKAPIHGNNLLYGQDRPWSRLATNVRFLNQKPSMSRKELYGKLLQFVDGWVFEAHPLVRHFLAAHILCVSHIDVFEHLPYILFTAPSQSGKTTFLKGVLRGEDPVDIALLEHVTGSDDYTSAAIMQSAVESTLMQALDEMESPDDHNKNDAKAKAVSQFLASVRNAAGRDGMRRTRGGRYGTPRERRLRFTIAASAIHTLKEEADRNRWFTLELKHQPGRTPPEEYIRTKFGRDMVAQMRKDILLHSLRNAYVDHHAEKEITKELFHDKVIKVRATRSAKSLAPALTIMKSVGMDYLGWGQSFLDWRADMLAASNTSAERTMFQAIMETNAILIPNEGIRRSAIAILADPDLRVQISAADCGIYHLPGSSFAVLYAKKLAEILRYNANYRNATNTAQIHSLLRRNPQVKYDPAFFRGNNPLMMHLRAYISNPRPEDLLAVSFKSLSFDDVPLSVAIDPDDVL